MSKARTLIPAWMRAVFVCVAIPTAWAFEVWIGLLLIRTPEVIVGDGPNLLGFILGLALIWLMFKTPLVLSLAFSPDGGHRTEKEEYSSE